MRTPMRGRLFAAVLAVAMLAAVPAAATPEDPALDQQIDPDQEVATDRAVLDEGHVDMGPKFLDGAWSLMVHDDTRIEGSVWRSLDETVIAVRDTAMLTVPDDPTYAFLGVDPGTSVHVVPQTQNQDAVWLGWNTQDPDVMQRIDRGVTLSLTAVEGPGHLVVYLQDGGFGEPDVLWDSRVAQAQPLWVDVNTHTHANWVFSEPGTYLVSVAAAAATVDGGEEEAVGTMRFAVGDTSDPEAAFAAQPAPAPADNDEGERDGAAAEGEPAASGDVIDEQGSAWPLVIAGAAVALVLALAGLLVRGRRVRARALAEDGS